MNSAFKEFFFICQNWKWHQSLSLSLFQIDHITFLLIYFLSDQCLKPHNTWWWEGNSSLFHYSLNIKEIRIRHLLFNLKNRECKIRQLDLSSIFKRVFCCFAPPWLKISGFQIFKLSMYKKVGGSMLNIGWCW